MPAEEVIEIQGDLIRRIQRTVVQESNLKDIIPFMENRVPVTLPALPRHPVRAVHWDESGEPNKTLDMLIEVPPGVRTLDWEDESGVTCRVAIPWTVFHINAKSQASAPRGEDWNLEEIRIFWAQEQIGGDLNQYVIPALLPNVYENGDICFGSTGTTPFQPLPDRIDNIINDFYMTAFNADLTLRFPWTPTSCETWVAKTAESRTCWRDFPEWDLSHSGVEHFQLKDLFTHELDRSTPRTLGNDIPPLTFLPTFGRTREWLEGLTNAQRLRLNAEITGLLADSPDLFALPPEPTDG